MKDGIIKDADSGGFTIPANGQVDIPAQGKFIRCLEGTGNFRVSMNDGGAIYFAPGMEYRPPNINGFTKVTLHNDTANPIDVIMAWGGGELRDGRVTLQSGKATKFITLNDVELTTDPVSVLDPNSARSEAIICNLDTGENVYIGGAALGAGARGTKLAPGQTAVLTHTAEVFAMAESGTPKIGISYTED